MPRYDRQIILPEIGDAGQEKLASARVLVVGVGGLGSPAALYLAGAGVGTIGLVDDDTVSEDNLQRQVLYATDELGLPKAVRAAERIAALNPEITVKPYSVRLEKGNVLDILSGFDIIVDGCDNFRTRYLINDACVKLGKIYVYGAIRAFEGQVAVFNHHSGKTYRDLYPDERETLSLPRPSKGVLGVTPGIVGCAEANEVMKIICGYGEVLDGKLWQIDLRTMETHTIML